MMVLPEANTPYYKPKILFVFLLSSSLILSLSASLPILPSPRFITPSREAFPTWGTKKNMNTAPSEPTRTQLSRVQAVPNDSRGPLGKLVMPLGVRPFALQ